jgi:outer membrane biosynthesis protein TonB
MHQPPSRPYVLASALAAVLAACGDSRDPLPAATADRQPASEQVQQMTGLSHMPRPESVDALNRSLARHYPRELAGVRPRSLVLVDVQLDEQGRVRDVRPVDRPATAPSNVNMVLVDEVPGNNTPVERTYQGTYDSAFGPAARAALQEVRFEPAMRNGRPVPYTLRMTVEFTSPQHAS